MAKLADKDGELLLDNDNIQLYDIIEAIIRALGTTIHIIRKIRLGF